MKRQPSPRTGLDAASDKSAYVNSTTRARGRPREPFPERFWRYVAKADCWVWTGALVRGYGQFWLDGRPQRATHVSWALAHGEPPAPGTMLCHRCDHPLCVNPEHLFLGTPAANSADASAKGQVPRGAQHYKARLSQQQARSVLQLARAGVPQAEIARRFGVTRSTIWSLVQGRSWKHLAPAP